MKLEKIARVIAVLLAVAIFIPFMGKAAVYSTNPIGEPLTIVFLREGKITTWEGWFIDPCSPLSLTILKSDGVTKITIPSSDLKQIHASATAAVGFEAYSHPSAFFTSPLPRASIIMNWARKGGVFILSRRIPCPAIILSIPRSWRILQGKGLLPPRPHRLVPLAGIILPLSHNGGGDQTRALSPFTSSFPLPPLPLPPPPLHLPPLPLQARNQGRSTWSSASTLPVPWGTISTR